MHGGSGISVNSVERPNYSDVPSATCSISGYQGPYDGIIELSSTEALDYTNRTPTGTEYDAVRVIEHEIDEILSGGGQGSTLNSVYGHAVFGSDMGPLDLYRCTCGSNSPSFLTSSGVDACLSVDGGATDIVQFNQNPSGDYGDFDNAISGCPNCEFSTTAKCPDHVQDAFTCTGQAANETTSSPEYQMMLSIGYDPVPEPASVALLSVGVGGIAVLRSRRRARQTGMPAGPTAVQS